MITYSSKAEIYLGRKAGAEILKTIKNARSSVKIVSPYLSAEYLKELVNLTKKKIKITLITCDELCQGDSYSDFKQSDIIKREKIENLAAKRKKQKGWKISMFSFLFTFFSFILSIFILSLFYFSLFLFLISLILTVYFSSIKAYSYQYYSIFKLRIFDSHSGIKPGSTNLIHSKIFIIDEEIAFLGSVNFTYSGFMTHYESVIKIQDKKAIADISREVENIYNSNELAYLPIEELGREIYS